MKQLTASIIAAALLTAGGNALAAEAGKTFSEKVIEMQELGIIHKEDDLKLDATLNRAQAVKLICSMRSIGADVTQSDAIYSDVTDSHWSYQYVMNATANGITDGYEDGTFRPENTVTAQEFVKMLVCAVGYGVYAEATGGYPFGYMTYGESLGITEDTEVSYNEPINRETAFNLLYNTLDVPLLVIDGYDFADGVAVPVYKVRDGEYFRSLRMDLTDDIAE